MIAVFQRPVFWLVVSLTLSAVTAIVIIQLITRSHLGGFAPAEAYHDHHHDSAPAHGTEGGTFHDWLHEQLKISPEQERALTPIEVAYARNREKLLGRVEAAGHRLSDALGASPVDQAVIDSALTEIRDAQGELQKATIGHFLEMKEHLTPDQAGMLLQWTRESIVHEHGN